MMGIRCVDVTNEQREINFNKCKSRWVKANFIDLK